MNLATPSCSNPNMFLCRISGHVFSLDLHLPQFLDSEIDETLAPVSEGFLATASSFSRKHAVGYVNGKNCQVEIWSEPTGVFIRVEGSCDFCIESGGQRISRPGKENDPIQGLDREVLLGPALVLALAMRATWSLHASAVRLNGKTIALLGESGYGKSTLAGFLGRSGLQRVADDILPVTGEANGVLAWPHFPQLKLPPEEQPALSLPENLPLNVICLLAPAGTKETPHLESISVSDAVTALLSHTAGTRLFWPELLSAHLAFCTQAAGQLAAYRLIYPHRQDGLPLVKEIFESLC